MKQKASFIFLMVMFTGATAVGQDAERDATEIVRDALNHWRGLSSHGVMTMTIHRSDWERTMSMESWSEGEKRSLVRDRTPQGSRQRHID